VVQQPISTDPARAQVDPFLLEKMMQPAFYPHPCQSVEPVQTLTAWLLFAGEFVYKVKAPVHFSFVDARTPARRYRLCRDEIELNRRLAPEVYLGLSGITGGYELVPNATMNGPGVCEFAIVMQRLPGDRMLSQLVASQTISPDEILRLSEKLAAFHLNCSIAKSKIYGSAPALSRLIAANVAEAGEFIADTVTRERLATAARYLRGFVITHQQLLNHRARSGCVRECHGNLRADSICLVPQALPIIGRVEYREELRYCDVASELAAVIIDLDVAGRNDLSDTFVRGYVAASGDKELGELIPFYKCYRAVRRGQFETLISLQIEMPRERRMLARHDASQWFQLAERVAAAVPLP
jgi:uncharacterized protein